jgi:general secretion pathway protein B
MSFILDALKKSETDRQQQSSAEFSGMPTSPQSPHVPRWFWVVGALLAINLAVLIGLLLQPNLAAPPKSQPSGESTTILPPTGDLAQPSFEEKVATARQNPPDKQLERPVVEAKGATREFVKPVLISQNPSAIPASDLYPTLQEVRASGSLNLPDLHLDIHVFSPRPDDRFVFVNMSKLREGSTLTEGPVVVEITPEGVVLRHEGQLFLLPRE